MFFICKNRNPLNIPRLGAELKRSCTLALLIKNMMYRIEQYFKGCGIFTDAEIKESISYFEMRKLKRNAFFIQEGAYCDEVAFIDSGIVRSCYTSQEGTDITYCFRFPDDFVTSYTSFITGNKSLESIQALSDVTLQVVKRTVIEEMSKESLSWNRFLRMMAEQQYMELEKRVFQLQRDGAGKRYQDLMECHPDYIRYIPLHYLASYLGITQRHLSRIRGHHAF